jgi:hypothetical protein
MDELILHTVLARLLAVKLFPGEIFKRHFLAVFADSLNALAVGAPLAPGFRIRSPDPDFILARFAMML